MITSHRSWLLRRFGGINCDYTRKLYKKPNNFVIIFLTYCIDLTFGLVVCCVDILTADFRFVKLFVDEIDATVPFYAV